MISMGITLTVSDFLRVLKSPKAVAVGFVGQTLVPGTLVYLLATVLDLPGHIALGMMIIAACPGGATSNAFSVMAKGDAALSISLTAVSSIFAFLTVPTLVAVGVSLFGGPANGVTLDFVSTATKVFSNTVVPLAIGMGLRQLKPALFLRLVKPLLYLGLGILIMPTFTFFDQFGSLISGSDTFAALSAIALNVLAMGCGFLLGKLTGLPSQQARTLSLEVGIQNYGLALIIIVTYMQDLKLLLPAIFYLPSMYVTGFIMVALADRFDKDNPTAADVLA